MTQKAQHPFAATQARKTPDELRQQLAALKDPTSAGYKHVRETYAQTHGYAKADAAIAQAVRMVEKQLGAHADCK